MSKAYEEASALTTRLEVMVAQRRAEVARLRELVATQEAANKELYETIETLRQCHRSADAV